MLEIQLSAFPIRTGIQFFAVPMNLDMIFVYLPRKFHAVEVVEQVKDHIFAERLAKILADQVFYLFYV